MRVFPHAGNDRFIIPNRYPLWPAPGTPPPVTIATQTLTVGTAAGGLTTGFDLAPVSGAPFGALAPSRVYTGEVVVRLTATEPANLVVLQTSTGGLVGGATVLLLHLDLVVCTLTWDPALNRYSVIDATSADYILSKAGTTLVVNWA